MMENYRKFFIFEDALCNLSQDFSFSLLPQYVCAAGCRFCYLNSKWQPNMDYDLNIQQHKIESLSELSKYFAYPVMMDDLLLLKNRYQSLYSFYIKNSHRFWAGSMTDRAFEQQTELYLNEMDFIGIYEISFSDRYIVENFDQIILPLSKLLNKYRIKVMKIIITDVEYSESPALYKFIAWLQQENIQVITHVNMLESSIESEEYYAEDGNLYPLLRNSVFLINDKFHLTLQDAVSQDSEAFSVIGRNGFDPKQFILRMLQFKIRKYIEFASEMKYQDNQHYQYFKNVAEDVVINENFNFIPSVMFNENWKFFDTLRREKNVKLTEFGMFFADEQEGVIPLVTWKSLS